MVVLYFCGKGVLKGDAVCTTVGHSAGSLYNTVVCIIELVSCGHQARVVGPCVVCPILRACMHLLKAKVLHQQGGGGAYDETTHAYRVLCGVVTNHGSLFFLSCE